MKPPRACALLLILSLAGCAGDRYQSNLQHAYVTPWTHLSRSDFEQIVRVVSDATTQPIIGIRREGRRIEHRVHVITGFPQGEATRGWTGHHLRKRGGVWRIVSHGEISQFVARMVLSEEL